MKKQNGIFDKVYTHKSPKTNKTEYRYRFYWYQTPDNSKRHYGYSDWSTTKEKARQNAQRKIDEKYARPIEDNRKLTIEQIAEKYIDYVKNLEVSEYLRPTSQACLVSNMRTLILNRDEATKKNIAHIPDYLRTRKISELSSSDMDNWINYIITNKSFKTGQRLRKKTVGKMYKTIRKFIYYANVELHCFVDDADRVPVLVDKTKQEKFVVDTSLPAVDKSNRVLDEEKFRIFMRNKFVPTGINTISINAEIGDKINKEYEYYILLSMFFYSGARISEVKPLTIEDVDWERPYKESPNRPDLYKANVRFNKVYAEKALKVTKEKHKNLDSFMKSPAAERIIPIYGIFARELFAYTRYLRYIFGREYNGLLFPGEKNAVMSSNAIQNKINDRLPNLKEFGITKFSPHDFRASRVTEFLLSGLEPKDIYWFFGHNSQKLVDGCYKRIKPEREYEKNKGFAEKKNFGDEEQQKLIEWTIQKQHGLIGEQP